MVKMSKNSKKSAFTLLELLVVIAIIGLLSSLVITQVRSARDKAHYAKALQFSAHLDRTLGAEAVGIWNFEEGTGTTATDVSGWGNHGTIHGATYTTETYNDEVSGYALSFDGLSTWVQVYPGIDLQEKDYTVSAWIKREEINQAHGIVTDRQYAFWSFTILSSNKLYLIHRGNYGGSSNYANGIIGSTHIGTEWTHVAGTFSQSSGMKIYVNGKMDGQNTDTVAPRLGSPRGPEFIGQYRNVGNVTSNVFDGLIDDVRIYSTALTAHEIKSHYLAGIDKLYTHGEIDEEEYHERLAAME